MDEQKVNIRPTKKQRELLTFIDEFITEHGYSPSYREIMAGCNYNSVATVSLHVNNLIKRGHILKRDHSARSLEVVSSAQDKPVRSNVVQPGDEKWLVEQVEHRIHDAEQTGELEKSTLDNIEILLAALRVLGFEQAAHSFAERMTVLRAHVAEPSTSD